MKKDLIIGIVGATILVAAMVGVFRYEASRTAGEAFDVSWDDKVLVGPTASGTTNENAQAEQTLEIASLNLTKLTFSLVWTDEPAGPGATNAPDTFEFTVITPEGDSQTGTSDSGRIDIVFDDLNARPLPKRILATDETAAHAQLVGDTGSLGTGTWSFVVKLTNAGDQVAPAGGVVVTADTSNAWTIETKEDVYQASLVPAQ